MLEIIEQMKGEICHHYDIEKDTYIASKANSFFGKIEGEKFEFKIQTLFINTLLSNSRYSRRLSRRDKSNCVLNNKKDGLVIIYLGIIYFYDLKKKILSKNSKLIQCRNVLHQGIATFENKIVFGEYGSNEKNEDVPIWYSNDDGRSWEIIKKIKNIKHIHGIYKDPFSKDLWISTGDLDGQCNLFQVVNKNFNNLIKHGDGTQLWRPVSINFTKEELIWGMDSNLQTSFIINFNRSTKKIKKSMELPGPNWYSKMFNERENLIQTSVEIGSGSKSNYAHIFFSNDMKNWNCVAKFKKDFLPMKLFKFGVVAFAEGKQSSKNFVFFGEALNGIDGKIFKAKIK